VARSTSITLRPTWPNRSSTHVVQIVGGSVNLIGNAAATTTETFLSLTLNRGEDIISVTAPGGQQSNLTLLSGAGVWTHGVNNGMTIFQGPNLGSAAGAGGRHDHHRHDHRHGAGLPRGRRCRHGHQGPVALRLGHQHDDRCHRLGDR